MVLDTSALLAVLWNEPERRQFVERIEATPVRLLSVATFVETSIVLEARKGAEGVRELDAFLERANIELVDVTPSHGRLARRAFANYGKGRHRAGLNYGDCFAYALAADTGEPLLFKGDDFQHTDVPQ
jgi:ribonuclease VapC